MFELFSKRRLRREGKYPPAPRSQKFSLRVREALFYTLREAIGDWDGSISYISGAFEGNAVWGKLHSELFTTSDEYHAFDRRANWNPMEHVFHFMRAATDGGVLDALDYGVYLVAHVVPSVQERYSDWDLRQYGVTRSAAQTLARLDEILRNEGTIYRIVQGEIIVSTDDYTYSEAIVPALRALTEPGFENALAEFHAALRDLREGERADALTKANHAFESTMKVIAAKKKWAYNETDTASKLVAVMIKNGLVPAMRESALGGLRVLLESDVPTLRNRTPRAGHGAGTQRPEVPEAVASYAVVVAAANIRLLIELYKSKSS